MALQPPSLPTLDPIFDTALVPALDTALDPALDPSLDTALDTALGQRGDDGAPIATGRVADGRCRGIARRVCGRSSFHT